MIKKEIEISVDASKAEAGLDDIATSIQDLNKEVTSFAKKGDKAIDDLSKSAKSAEKNTKTLAEGFKGAGLALKAMGIGLVIEGMQMLKEVFMSNQTVADGFSAVMGTVSSVFTQVTNVIISVTEKVSKNSKGFEGLTNVIKGLMTIALTPLKLAFYNVQLALNGIQLAWEESPFGDGDPKRIKELKKRIEDAALSIKETGKEAVKAGVQVATNLGKAGKEVGQVVSGTIDGVSKINVAATYEQAKANVRLQNTAKIAEAEQARLVERYDRQAEKLRQLRDDENKTISARIKANEDLKNVLDNQEKAMLAQADAQIAAAKMTYQQNKTIENQVALKNALTNREGVLAQIEGFRSEQKANAVALGKEEDEINKSNLETATELAKNQKNFDAERIRDIEKKLNAQKDALQSELDAETDKYNKSKEKYAEGTQARAELDKEYALKKQELENGITAKEDELALTKYEKSVEQAQKIIDNDKMAFDARFAALTEQENLIKNNTILSEEERTKALADNTKARIELTKAESEYRIAQAQEVGNALGALGDLVGKQTAAGKALGIAQALINTYIGVTEILRQKSVLPSPADYIAKAINVAATLASGFKAVKAITSVKVPGGGGGGNTPSGFGTSGGASPSFNVVGNSGVNALAQTIGTQTQKPLQAYVVAQNVTTAQSLNRNIIQSATLG